MAVDDKKAKAEETKATVAKVSKIVSRGRDYTQLWIPREVGEQLAKGATYEVARMADGKLVFTPTVAEKSARKPRAAKP
jgi:hypothetical protein